MGRACLFLTITAEVIRPRRVERYQQDVARLAGSAQPARSPGGQPYDYEQANHEYDQLDDSPGRRWSGRPGVS